MTSSDGDDQRYAQKVDFSKNIEKVRLPSAEVDGNGKGKGSYELQKQVAYIADLKNCGIYAKLLPKHVTVLFHYPVSNVACFFQSAKGYFAQFLYSEQKLTETGIELLKFFYRSADKERPHIYLIYDPAESLDEKGTAYKRAKRFSEAHQASAVEFKDQGARIWTMALQPYTEKNDNWLLIRSGDSGPDIVTEGAIERQQASVARSTEAKPLAPPKKVKTAAEPKDKKRKKK